MTVVFLWLALFVLTLFAYYVKKHFSKTSDLRYYASKLEGPPALPLIGSAYYLLGSNKQFYKNVLYLIEKYKPPWKIWLGTQLYIVVTEPEDIEVVLNKALAKASNYKFAAPVLGEGLFTAPVDKWKPHRKVIASTFSMPILNSFVEVFSEHSHSLVKRLESQVGKCFDVFPLMRRCALEVICETVMDQKVCEKSQNFDYPSKLSRAMDMVSTRLFQWWLYPNFIWRLTSYCRHLNQLSKDIRKFVTKIVADKKQEFLLQQDDFCAEHSKRKCFLDYLVELSERSEHWTDSEILQEAQTMVVAGSDSLGSSTSYILMMIGMHSSVQNQVFEEIYSIFGDSDRDVTSKDLPKMVYLERVIKETLRLFPLVGSVGRRVDENIVTSNYTLPAGCECIVAILYTHRNPKIWQDPDKFDPDRFLPEEVSKRHPYSYLAFSGGLRGCIGYKYAMTAMKTVVTTVVRNYKISTDFQNTTDIDFVPGIVLKCAKGYRIALESRK